MSELALKEALIGAIEHELDTLACYAERNDMELRPIDLSLQALNNGQLQSVKNLIDNAKDHAADVILTETSELYRSAKP